MIHPSSTSSKSRTTQNAEKACSAVKDLHAELAELLLSEEKCPLKSRRSRNIPAAHFKRSKLFETPIRLFSEIGAHDLRLLEERKEQPHFQNF